ncbi:MAG: TIR domain-containing protein [Chloroflexi bacterium]|nr:TIR domain-containing protein [Chloroflexota bacterium]MCC6896674.1 TIR domain-containing protein [Anaerolineae bacterium]
MPKIFISYRRADSNDIAERIYDNLANAFGEDNVFKDQYSIKPGEDFRDSIRREVGTVDVLLVLIGPDWLTVTQSLSNGTVVRRIDHPDDWVRREVEVGIERLTDTNKDDAIQVIPILVRGASMPPRDELPESIRHLAFLQGYRVRSDSDFRRDIGVLINHLRGESSSKPNVPSQPEEHLAALQNPQSSSPPVTSPPSLIRRLRLNEPWAIILAALITVGFPFLVSQINNQQNTGAATPTIPVTNVAVDRSTDTPLPPTSTDTPLPPTATDTPVPTAPPQPSSTVTINYNLDETATQIMLQRTADAKSATNEALFAESTNIVETANPRLTATASFMSSNLTTLPNAFPCGATVINPNNDATLINSIYQSESLLSSKTGHVIRVGSSVDIQRSSTEKDQVMFYLIYSENQRLGWLEPSYLELSESCFT